MWTMEINRVQNGFVVNLDRMGWKWDFVFSDNASLEAFVSSFLKDPDKYTK